MKVLHLPTDTAGNAWGLSRAERGLGLHSEVLSQTESSLGYSSDIQLNLEKITSKELKYLKKIYAFFKIRSQYDVFHFNYGSSLLHQVKYPFLYQLDLPFYPKKAKLFVTYNGCDARQKYPTMQRTSIAACHDSDCYGGACNSGKRDEIRIKSIEKMSRYARHMWAISPDLLYFLPKNKSSFLPCTIANFDCEKYLPKFEKKLKILHAPTNRAAKGSGYILSALEKLQKKYPDSIETLLVENMSHKQAMELYKNADLVIDQILIGWYGAFAVETMLMGKPVIARIAYEDLKFIPHEMANDLMQTIIHADPFNIESVIERCIDERTFLKQRSEASIAYASKWHHPNYIASITKEKYES